MTKDQRIQYSQKHSRRVKLFERQYLRRVFNAIHSQISEFVSDMKHRGIHDAKRELDRTVINDKIAPVIRELYLEVGLYKANMVLREINGSVREVKAGFGFNEEWVQAILNYFRTHLLDKAVFPITQTTKDQILQVLTQAEQEGWGIDRIVKELLSSELTLWRARLIVRTELVKAMHKGHELAKEKSRWETEDTWIAAHDLRTRRGHAEVDGDTVGSNGKFRVPRYKKIGKISVFIGWDFMSGPGDPNAHIDNIANCRCTKVTRAKRDENGRLIPKRQMEFI